MKNNFKKLIVTGLLCILTVNIFSIDPDNNQINKESKDTSSNEESSTGKWELFKNYIKKSGSFFLQRAVATKACFMLFFSGLIVHELGHAATAEILIPGSVYKVLLPGDNMLPPGLCAAVALDAKKLEDHPKKKALMCLAGPAAGIGLGVGLLKLHTTMNKKLLQQKKEKKPENTIKKLLKSGLTKGVGSAAYAIIALNLFNLLFPHETSDGSLAYNALGGGKNLPSFFWPSAYLCYIAYAIFTPLDLIFDFTKMYV